MSKLVDLTTMTASTIADDDRLLIHDEDAGPGGTDRTITVDELFKRPLNPTLVISGESATTRDAALTKLNEKKQNQTLATPLTIAGTSRTTVEAALGAIADVDSAPTENSTKFVTSGGVHTAIANAISTVYKPKGSVAFASLPALGASVLGNVYNITDGFTTTADFVEGAGKEYPANTNVVVVDTDTTGASPAYKFDVFTGLVDMTPYQTKEMGTSVTVDGTEKTTVETAISALNTYADKKGEQYAVLPEASADLLGKIVQYTGADSGDLVGGYFYKCVADDNNPVTYSWEQCPVQEPMHVDGSTIVKDASTNELSAVTATQSTVGVVKGGDGTSIGSDGSVNVVDRLVVVSTMPTASAELSGKHRLYVGADTASLNKGGIYECQETDTDVFEWVLISTADVDLTGYKTDLIKAKQSDIPSSEIEEYDTFDTYDEPGEGVPVYGEVAEGDYNPVDGDSVYSALSGLVKTVTLANRTFTLPEGGYVNWANFTGLSSPPKMCWFRMTDFSGASQTDCFASFATSKYGAHVRFATIADNAPISGEVTVSGTVYYIV